VDIGASGGRHILGWVQAGRIALQEVYRFPNTQVRRDGRDCWDTQALFAHLVAGLKACREAGKTPDSMGVDTWGVDYVLLDAEGRLIGDAVAYRDARTQGADALAEAVLPFEALYARTGIQKLPFNTVYQLLAHRRDHPEQLAQASRFLMMPDYLHYLLTGVPCNEYTNATTTALVSARHRDWDRELLAALRLPAAIFGPLRRPGETLGGLAPGVRDAVGFDCRVVLPATHDTGAAFLAVPAKDDRAVYLSSGTWSLLGAPRPAPIATPQSQAAGFTNEGGYGGTYRFLKNIMGLWMLQSIRREISGEAYVSGAQPDAPAAGHACTFADLQRAARAAADFPSLVDVDDPAFLAPPNMAEAVRRHCLRTGQPVPQDMGQLAQCVYASLARAYRDTIRQLSALTGVRYTAVHIVGGGSQDAYLNELTARAAGLPVYAGPTEGTALGNLVAQMIAAGEYRDLGAARAAVRQSFTVKEVLP
jgi:rhamnulokinase